MDLDTHLTRTTSSLKPLTPDPELLPDTSRIHLRLITPTLGGEEQTTRRLHHQTTRVVVEPTTRVQAGGFLTTRVLAGGFPTTRAEADEFLNTLVPADGFLTTRVPADGFPITWEVAEGVRTFHWRVVEHPTTLAGTLEHLTTDTPTTQRVVAPTTREEGAGQLIPSTTNTFLLPLVTPTMSGPFGLEGLHTGGPLATTRAGAAQGNTQTNPHLLLRGGCPARLRMELRLNDLRLWNSRSRPDILLGLP